MSEQISGGTEENRESGEGEGGGRVEKPQMSRLIWCLAEWNGVASLAFLLPPCFSNQGLHYSVGRIPSKGGEDGMQGTTGCFNRNNPWDQDVCRPVKASNLLQKLVFSPSTYDVCTERGKRMSQKQIKQTFLLADCHSNASGTVTVELWNTLYN